MSIIKPDMISENITRRDMLPMSFLKKSAYTGSKRSLNYKLVKAEVPVSDGTDGTGGTGETGGTPPETGEKPPETKPVLRVYGWFGKFAFDHTPAEQIESADFPFSDAGIDEAVIWLNGMLKKEEA